MVKSLQEIIEEFTLQRIHFRAQLAEHKKMTDKTALDAIKQAYHNSLAKLNEVKRVTEETTNASINQAYQKGDFKMIKAFLELFGKSYSNSKIEVLEKSVEGLVNSVPKKEVDKEQYVPRKQKTKEITLTDAANYLKNQDIKSGREPLSSMSGYQVRVYRLIEDHKLSVREVSERKRYLNEDEFVSAFKEKYSAPSKSTLRNMAGYELYKDLRNKGLPHEKIRDDHPEVSQGRKRKLTLRSYASCYQRYEVNRESEK